MLNSYCELVLWWNNEMEKLAVPTFGCVQNNFSSFSPSAQNPKWMEYVAVNPTTRSFIVVATNYVRFEVMATVQTEPLQK